MDKFQIEGGKVLAGQVKISGAKNSVLPIMAASILAAVPVRLSNVPRLRDVETMSGLLVGMGVNINSSIRNELQIDASSLTSFVAPYELVKTMRASFLVLGPLLARYGVAEVSLPGGCAIGARPVDLHIKGLEALGAKIEVDSGYVKAEAPRGGLIGQEIFLPGVSVGATENLIMAAVLADGFTTIHNAAREPEIVDLVDFLINMGAEIKGQGGPTIEIKGVSSLKEVSHSIIGDRIEAGTYLIAVAASGGKVQLEGFDPKHASVLLDKLKLAGAELQLDGNLLNLNMHGSRPTPVDFETDVYPGFPTDMQAQFMVMNCIADGRSVIHERIFENRFLHVQELSRLGAKIELRGNSTAIVTGVDRLKSAQVMATDLRASSSLVIGALVAEGKSTIDRIYHIDRGYEDVEQKVKKLGGAIERVR